MATITWWKMTGTKHATGCKTRMQYENLRGIMFRSTRDCNEDDRSLEVNKVKRLHDDEHRDH
jgi:hypothetical protein